MKILFVGASGYGNIGDDTYVKMFRHYLTEHELMFCNSDLPGGGEPVFPECDAVVLGGGGLIYGHEHHFQKMTWYLEEAHKRNIPFACISVGFQFKPLPGRQWAKDSVHKWKDILTKAEVCTVRSPEDERFMQDVFGYGAVRWYPDLCYGFPGILNTELPAQRDRVCLIPGASVGKSLALKDNTLWAQEACVRNLVGMLKQMGLSEMRLLRMGAPGVDGQKITCLGQRYPHASKHMGEDSAGCVRCIASSKAVITARYHGMVFARACNIPYMTLPSSPWKIHVEDTESNIADHKKHIDTLREFLESCNG